MKTIPVETVLAVARGDMPLVVFADWLEDHGWEIADGIRRLDAKGFKSVERDDVWGQTRPDTVFKSIMILPPFRHEWPGPTFGDKLMESWRCSIWFEDQTVSIRVALATTPRIAHIVYF